MICLCLTGRTLEDDCKLAEEMRGFYDLVELRADFLERLEPADLAQFPGRLADRLGHCSPIILTVRQVNDGGRFSGGLDEFAALMRLSLSEGYRYVDLPYNCCVASVGDGLLRRAAELGVAVICSIHDLQGGARDVDESLEKISRIQNVIPKIAITPRSIRDLMALFDAPKRNCPRIVLGMGEYGFPTRILSRWCGSLWTYCSSSDARSAASGQIDPRILVEEYRHRDIGRKSALFGIIGNPALHSRSPRYHNGCFREAQIDALYVPFHCDSVDDFFSLADVLNIAGFSVTIPHKQAVIAHLNWADDSVEATGACNTVVRSKNGEWRGYNSDVEGFLAPLRSALPLFARRRALVIGAGGAARAVVYALLKEGFSIDIRNRSVERAKALRRSFASQADYADRIAVGNGDGDHRDGETTPVAYGLIAQTTSVGMTPDIDADPIADFRFSGEEVVYDIIYTPEETALLRRAREAGCRVIGGMDMFTAQADIQRRLFRRAFEERR